MKKTLRAIAVAAIFLTPALHAQETDNESTFDKMWKFAEWYKDDENRVVQSVLFTGRFQYEYAHVDADQGSLSEWNIRRLRMGAKSKFFRAWTLHGEVEIERQDGDWEYARITDFYLQWRRNDQLELTIGKQGAPFTMDGATSSKELLTIDRSNLSNNLWFSREYIPGLSVSGTLSNWVYHVGAYSAGRVNREFGEFNGSVFTLASGGYDFARLSGLDEFVLTGSYVYQNPDPDNTFTQPLQHIASVNVRLEAGRWGARADVSGAAGYQGQSDLWGVMVMPFFNVTDKLQLVGRHTFMSSEDDNGLRLARYENRVTPGRGDQYKEAYLGGNYYFYGHKLKLQTGVQFADMTDRAEDGGAYSGISWTTGVRVSW